MFRKIMVAYDETPESGRRLDEAINLAKTLQVWGDDLVEARVNLGEILSGAVVSHR